MVDSALMWRTFEGVISVAAGLALAAPVVYLVGLAAVAACMVIAAVFSVAVEVAKARQAAAPLPSIDVWAVEVVDAIQPAREVLAHLHGVSYAGETRDEIGAAWKRLDALRVSLLVAAGDASGKPEDSG